MPLVIETYQEFLERHGKELVRVSHDFYLLPTGAAVQQGFNGPMLAEPSPITRERLKMQRRYHAIKSSLFETSFNALKSALLGGGTFQWNTEKLGPPEPGNGIASLMRLKELTEKHRREIAHIDEETEALPEVQEQRRKEQEQREWDDAQRQAESTFRQQVAAIELDCYPNEPLERSDDV